MDAVSDGNTLSLTASVWSRVSRLHRARRRAARPPTCLPKPALARPLRGLVRSASSGALADREVPHPPSPTKSNACRFLEPRLMRPVEHSR